MLIRVVTIFCIILLTSLQSKGQASRVTIQDASQRILKVYPNPGVTITKFEFQKNYERGYKLQIINFIGKQVHETKNINSSTTLDLASFNRGVYIYQLIDQSGKVVESGKFQVSK